MCLPAVSGKGDDHHVARMLATLFFQYVGKDAATPIAATSMQN